MGAIVPQVVGAVDPDELIERLDIDALMARVDIDALLTRIDIDALLTRIDIDALLTRIDVDGMLGRIDVSALIARIDMNEVISQVDLNALLEDVDIKAIVAKAGIDQIVAEASTGMIARTLDLARRQLVGIDIIILGAVDRLLRRGRQQLPHTAKLSATGRPAGPVSRLVGFGLDLFFVSALFGLVVAFGTWMVGLFTGDLVQPTDRAGIAWMTGYFAWFGLYLWGSIEIAGRTPGKALVGLRVVALDGRPLGPARAFWRTFFFPFSFILGLGFIPGVTRRDRRAFHELMAGCHEIVDWGDRDAGVPSALESWVARQADAQAAAQAEAASRAQPEVIEVELQVTPADESGSVDEPVAAKASPVLTEPVSPGELAAED